MQPTLFRPAPLVATAGALALFVLGATGAQDGHPALPHYICYKAAALTIDGRLDEHSWYAADWSEPFVDIEGGGRPAPRWLTRFKLLWDNTYLYVGAELEEPHVWATLTERDAVIYHDNDFEIFIDPDGDTHSYYEIEVNALGTVWDLMLVKPYRDGGPAVPAWDIGGLRVATSIQGTLNDPSDLDHGWRVELAIPWTAMTDGTHETRAPRDGDTWRLNFSRVQWELEVVGDSYRKATDLETEKPLPEDNWAWSPLGAVNMHMPERWGIVQFSELTVGEGSAEFVPLVDRDIRWALRRIYYAQRAYFRANGRYADSLAALRLEATTDLGVRSELTIVTSEAGYIVSAEGSNTSVWHIRQDGRIWKEESGG